jgi:hypothetical protein
MMHSTRRCRPSFGGSPSSSVHGLVDTARRRHLLCPPPRALLPPRSSTTLIPLTPLLSRSLCPTENHQPFNLWSVAAPNDCGFRRQGFDEGVEDRDGSCNVPTMRRLAGGCARDDDSLTRDHLSGFPFLSGGGLNFIRREAAGGKRHAARRGLK